jgi:hypothetical protein
MDPYVFPGHLPESVPFQERCMTWNLPHENITTTTGSLWMSSCVEDCPGSLCSITSNW